MSNPASTRTRINPEIWIRLPHHFWLKEPKFKDQVHLAILVGVSAMTCVERRLRHDLCMSNHTLRQTAALEQAACFTAVIWQSLPIQTTIENVCVCQGLGCGAYWLLLLSAGYTLTYLLTYSSETLNLTQSLIDTCLSFGAAFNENFPSLSRGTLRIPLAIVNSHHDMMHIEQKFNTNCPSLWAIRRCKNIAEKFKSLPRVQQCYRQTTGGRLMP